MEEIRYVCHLWCIPYYFTTDGSASITISQVGDSGFCEISCYLLFIIIIYFAHKTQVQTKHMYIRQWAVTARLDNQH